MVNATINPIESSSFVFALKIISVSYSVYLSGEIKPIQDTLLVLFLTTSVVSSYSQVSNSEGAAGWPPGLVTIAGYAVLVAWDILFQLLNISLILGILFLHFSISSVVSQIYNRLTIGTCITGFVLPVFKNTVPISPTPNWE